MLTNDYVLFAAVFAAAGGIHIGLAIKKKQLTKDRIINMVLRWAFADICAL